MKVINQKSFWDYVTETSNNNSDLNEFYYHMGLRDEQVIETLSPEQEEVITKYCDAVFNSGAKQRNSFIG